MGSLIHLRFTGAALAALAAVLSVKDLAVQSGSVLFAGGGLALPSGVYNSYADNGWAITGGWERRLGHHPAAVRVDVAYATNRDTTGVGFTETTHLITGMASVLYHFDGSRPHLYALAGMGYFGRRFSSSDPDDPPINDARFGLQIGEGVVFRFGSVKLFAEGRFVTGVGPDPLRYFPVVLGVRFGDSQP